MQSGGSGSHKGLPFSLPELFTSPESFVLVSLVTVGLREDNGTILDGSGLILYKTSLLVFAVRFMMPCQDVLHMNKGNRRKMKVKVNDCEY